MKRWGDAWQIVVTTNKDDARRFASEGWEPFAVEGENIWLKRRLYEKVLVD